MVRHLGFSCCDVDQAVFFWHKGGTVIIVLVHVDNCTITATTIKLIEHFKQEIAKHVKITNLGELHWSLEIEIKHNREKHTIHLSQHSYIDSILCRYNLQDLKPVSISMETSIHLSTSQSPATTAEFAQMCNVPYHKAVGSLMYTSLGTCPDISFAVQMVSHFSMKPGLIHWDAVKQIFWYLKGTKELWLSFGHAKIDLAGYADADGSMSEDRLGMPSLSMVELFLGVPNIRILSHCQQPRVVMLRLGSA
jgi:hypothetical protein